MIGDSANQWPTFQDQQTPYQVNSIYDVAPSFLGDLSAYFTMNPFPIPIDQVTGFVANTPFAASITSSDSTNSLTYVDLPNPGPVVTGLPDGTYVVMMGAQARNSAAGNGSRMSIQVDGTPTQDTDGSAVTTADYSGLSFAMTKVLSGAPAGGHTINTQYRVGAVSTGTFTNRYVVAIRIAGP